MASTGPSIRVAGTTSADEYSRARGLPASFCRGLRWGSPHQIEPDPTTTGQAAIEPDPTTTGQAAIQPDPTTTGQAAIEPNPTTIASGRNPTGPHHPGVRAPIVRTQPTAEPDPTKPVPVKTERDEARPQQPRLGS
jgi:hypothetical protein